MQVDRLDEATLQDLFDFASKPPKRGFYVVDYKGHLVFVFRPTEGSVFDWMWNFFVAPLGGIHLGFSLMYVLLVNRVLRVLELRERQMGIKRDVIFAGFSRGGALAEMCATDPLFKTWNTVAVSFGAPKWSIRRIQADNVLRVQAGGDIVCRLPPWPFKRVGVTRKLDWSWKPSFKAHSFSTYREALRRSKNACG